MTTNPNELTAWIGHTLVDENGDKIGKIVDIYADEATGQPEWIAVNTGRFGTNISFVPLAGAVARGDDLQVPFPGKHVSDAPNAKADGQLSQEEESRLYRHYGMDYSDARSDSGLPQGGTQAGYDDTDTSRRKWDTTGYDTSGPTTDDAMTRSEEELRVGTERQEAGRVRLRKYVVTENETRTVPVSREEVRVEREPITDANVDAAMDGPAISEEEHEVVLHEERPVVSKEAVPKERVRLDKDTVTDERQVSEEVRKERIETDDDALRRDR
ncbi:MAG TPA: PRC and DUF2382 domain-containing protein [Acidimicrobiales bacterium]|nr:PRC and DUF2382 domain-containing protein [Acidimicrobiales bacterium]